MTQFYKQHDTSKLGSVAQICAESEGFESVLNARLLDMYGADLSVAGDEFKRPDHQALHALPVNPGRLWSTPVVPGATAKSTARLHSSTPDEVWLALCSMAPQHFAVSSSLARLQENYMEFGALACHQLHRIWRDPDLWEHEEEYNSVRVLGCFLSQPSSRSRKWRYNSAAHCWVRACQKVIGSICR